MHKYYDRQALFDLIDQADYVYVSPRIATDRDDHAEVHVMTVSIEDVVIYLMNTFPDDVAIRARRTVANGHSHVVIG